MNCKVKPSALTFGIIRSFGNNDPKLLAIDIGLALGCTFSESVEYGISTGVSKAFGMKIELARWVNSNATLVFLHGYKPWTDNCFEIVDISSAIIYLLEEENLGKWRLLSNADLNDNTTHDYFLNDTET